MTISDARYELNTATASDAQGGLTSDPDTVTNTSNGILDQNILSCRTIREVSVFPPPTNPRIAKIRKTPQTLPIPVVKEIFTGATSDNVWTNRNPGRIIRNGVDRSIRISTPIHNGMSKLSTPDYSDSNVTSIPIGTIDNTNSPTCGINVIPKIDNIQKSATPDLIKSYKLDAAIDENFPNNLVTQPIFY